MKTDSITVPQEDIEKEASSILKSIEEADVKLDFLIKTISIMEAQIEQINGVVKLHDISKFGSTLKLLEHCLDIGELSNDFILKYPDYSFDAFNKKYFIYATKLLKVEPRITKIYQRIFPK